MEKKYINMNQLINLFFLNNQYNSTQLEFLTKFNILNNLAQPVLNKIVLNFSFKNIAFNEKKVIPFFLALELITGQKGAVTIAKKPILMLKIQKGMLVGCKVTLRKKQIYRFLDYLLLALPRSEKFKGIFFNKIKNSNKNTFLINLYDLFIFYQLESELDHNIQQLQITYVFNTNIIEKKVFLLSSYKLPILL